MPRLYAAGRRQSRQILATHFREKSAYLTSAISSSCRSYCFLFLATYPGLEPALFDAVMRTYLACGQGNFGLTLRGREELPRRAPEEEEAHPGVEHDEEVVLDEAERDHLAGPLRKEQHPENDGHGVHGPGHRRAEEDHRQIAEHLADADRHAEEPERQRVDDHRPQHRGRAQRQHRGVVPDAGGPERAEERALAHRAPPADPSAEEEMEEHEDRGGGEREPGNQVEDAREPLPPEQHAERRPAEKVVVRSEES